MSSEAEFPETFPFAVGPLGEPPVELSELRAKCPVSRVTLPSGDEAWVVTGYDEVSSALSEQRLSRAALREPGAVRMVKGPDFGDNPYSLFNLEGADHARLRRMIAQAFSPRRAEVLRPRVQEIADELVDRLLQLPQPVDVYAEFCALLPIWVVCEIVGAPVEDREQIKEWTETLMSVGSNERRLEAREAFGGYVRGLVAARRAEPQDDLLSILVQARDEDDRLSEAELTWLGAELLLAGHDTTVNTLGRGIFQLLRHRDQWELLTARPQELTDSATEEVFRYAPPSDAGLIRVALEDFDLAGTAIRKGEGVIPLMHAAARDERHFAEPERFDITRTGNRHLVFGYGPHHCPAAGVARMEVQVALGTLARRVPQLALAVAPEEVAWRGGHITLRPETVPVIL
ncbi:cytochrome P450 [Streptacidiphilus jiangxiensis]|uniref:Cytochrome P450 n=1 Tax=Streptacidiphilus jiangxiensis TaxID=235985 RepID=A0A1H7VLE2_STRJI|nr:cytochrome P450 [Streptacidiphilus jiangxiensis]SEM09980.1 Cytochrome P450 [Streptacidiphilus jiangxiensis]